MLAHLNVQTDCFVPLQCDNLIVLVPHHKVLVPHHKVLNLQLLVYIVILLYNQIFIMFHRGLTNAYDEF